MKLVTGTIAGILMLTFLVSNASANETVQATAQPDPVSAETFQAWGEEVLQTIRKDFWLAKQGQYAERIGINRPLRKIHPTYMWGAGVQLTALAAAADLSPDKHTDALNEYINALESYWVTHNEIQGYDVQPSRQKVDRYYDDNAWIVLALIEAYEVTNDPSYLAKAISTFNFVMSGEDGILQGGIYWRENVKKSKNTCVSAPTIVSALRLYQHTKEPEHLATAKRLYEWTCSHLQNPTDGLFWDHIALNGNIDKRVFSYNSALMIRANCLFYETSKEERYLKEAQRIARSAEYKWVDQESGAMRDTGKFAHLLLESFIALHEQDNDPHWISTVKKCVVHVHQEIRDSQGHYPSHWHSRRKKPMWSAMLIDQASVARAYLVVAKALPEN